LSLTLVATFVLSGCQPGLAPTPTPTTRPPTTTARPVPTVTVTPTPIGGLVVDMPYQNAEMGLSLRYPKGWFYQDEFDTVVFAADKADLGGSSFVDGRAVAILAGEDMTQAATPQAALQEVVDGLDVEAGTLGEVQATTLDDEPGASVLISGALFGEDAPYTVYLLVAFHDGLTYVVLALAPETRWAETWPAYQEMLDSFVFIARPITPTPEPTTRPITPTPTPTVVAGQTGGFAAYQPLTVTIPAQYAGADYALPLDLATVAGLKDYAFSPDQAKLLADNGFVARAGDYKEFFVLYEQARYGDRPVLVTTDSLLHVYHLMFDKVLRTAEVDYFSQDLAALDQAMYQASLAQVSALKGTEWEPAALRNAGYFCVALRLLGANLAPPEPIKDAVEAELTLIDKHEGWAVSPLWGNKYREDYSQYVPRGHYTRNETLQTYFKAMMWHGRLTFRQLYDDETASAMLLCLALRDAKTSAGTPALTLWERIYDPTVFFVGRSDDLGYHEYYPLLEEVYGPVTGPQYLMDEAKFAQFKAEAKKLEGPKINSMFVLITEDREEVTKGFRFMGQRFVLDAYIFQQLIWREVGVQGNERWLPRGLDVFAALGSAEAYGILEDMGETKYENYDKQLEKVRGEIAGLPESDWTQNLYWSWLYCLRPLADAKSASYPAWMRTTAWTRKDLHSALGSWTELKHDTILYAKQAYAELGGAPEPESKLVGWVEPNPHVFARLAGLTRMTIDGLDSRGLLNDADRDALVQLEGMARRCQSIAEKELRGEAVSEEEAQFMRFYGGSLEQITLASADKPAEAGGQPYLDENSAALVTDVATDGQHMVVLEEAIGRIDEVYVVVRNPGGAFYVCQGGIFSYYEFTWPMSDRLTDEKWQQMLAEGKAPERPGWIDSFFAGSAP
ncbi:MAG: DUF3160 domain-containing protein, partial [Chloroflexi bacterium]|nr:DUF3160 domain-containing protein [Chloroflexota bacterium]